MRSHLLGRIASVLLLGGSAAACATARPAELSAQAAPAQAAADTARRSYTAADVAFMTGMIAHHGQALEMARLAPTNGARTSIRTLAARIINAQQDEIALLQQWLRDRGLPVPEPEAAHHGDHGAHHAMPGMLTSEQMAQLGRARDEEFDRLFLTLMIQHHQGATAMVDELLRHPGAAQDLKVFEMASDINVDQTTEIERMRLMLADVLFETPAP